MLQEITQSKKTNKQRNKKQTNNKNKTVYQFQWNLVFCISKTQISGQILKNLHPHKKKKEKKAECLEMKYFQQVPKHKISPSTLKLAHSIWFPSPPRFHRRVPVLRSLQPCKVSLGSPGIGFPGPWPYVWHPDRVKTASPTPQGSQRENTAGTQRRERLAKHSVHP